MLLLDKPSGMSSNTALQRARRLFSAAKAGHTGTLDPLATGLLPLCFGEATKFSADLLDADKTYEAELRFGVTTETGDAEGGVLETRPVTFSGTALAAALDAFRGPIRQVPPMYSALKRDGKPLYVLARQGIEVERQARDVTIHALELLGHAGETCCLRVACSKGTYIRTLATDLGERLGCGAHLTALRRTAVGSLTLETAWTLEALEAQDETTRESLLLPPDGLLQNLPRAELAAETALRFCHGNPVSFDAAGGAPGRWRVYADGRLLGLGELTNDGVLKPSRLIAASA